MTETTSDSSHGKRHELRDLTEAELVNDIESLDEDYAFSANDEAYIDPCAVCGSKWACQYDADGRPLIHIDPDEGTE